MFLPHFCESDLLIGQVTTQVKWPYLAASINYFFLTFFLFVCLKLKVVSVLNIFCKNSENYQKWIILYLSQTDCFAPASHSAAQQPRPPHSRSQCWCCSHPGRCLSEGRLSQSCDTRRSSDPLKGERQRKNIFSWPNEFRCEMNASILAKKTNKQTKNPCKHLEVTRTLKQSQPWVKATRQTLPQTANNTLIIWCITNTRTRHVVKALTVATFFTSSSDIVLVRSCND